MQWIHYVPLRGQPSYAEPASPSAEAAPCCPPVTCLHSSLWLGHAAFWHCLEQYLWELHAAQFLSFKASVLLLHQLQVKASVPSNRGPGGGSQQLLIRVCHKRAGQILHSAAR